MSSAQDRLVMAATLVAESVWLYAVFALVGLALDRNGSPLGWVAVLTILSSSFLVARVLGLIRMPMVVAYSSQMLFGVLVLFLVLGTQMPSDGHGLDLGWIGKLGAGRGPEGYAIVAALGGILGAVLWWRGGRLASSDYVVDSLGVSFRVGVMILAVAAVVDMFHSADLNIFPLMFVFFASGLAGLSIGHILPASRRAIEERTWTRVIAGVVSLVLMAGLLFSLLQRGVLSFISGPIVAALNAMAAVVFFVVIVPVAYLVDFLVKALRFLLGRFVTEPEEAERADPSLGVGEMLKRWQEGAGDEGPSALLQVLEWTLVIIILLLVLFLLARAFRHRIRWRRVLAEGMRESIAEDVDPAYDLARLLFNLLPSRFKKRVRGQALRLPEDDPDVVDVFRVYFGLLVLAEERGFPRPPDETPIEYQRTLERIFPRDLVSTVTAAFVRACYGHHGAPRKQILEMRASLERLASGAG